MAPRDARVTAVQLFGLVPADGAHHGAAAPGVPGVGLVAFRELAALVSESQYERIRPSSERVRQYRRVLEAAFAQRSVLPAPFGTVFRSHGELVRWLELHYFTLVDAMGFVEDRVMARVRVAPANVPSLADTGEIAAKVADLESSAAESFRVLRRHSVASIPAPPQPGAGGPSVQASFLVERERWTAFGDVVKDEARRSPELAIDHTGPWPPYDFVRMEFGG
jgi:hypothetical protein